MTKSRRNITHSNLRYKIKAGGVKGVWEEKDAHPEEQMKQTGPLPIEHSYLFIPVSDVSKECGEGRHDIVRI